MLDFQAEVNAPVIDWPLVNREAKSLADDLALHVQMQMKLALIRMGAVATGKTLRSIEKENTLDSPSRVMYMRNIVGSSVWQYIQMGRRPGGKMPPESAMLEWFKVFNIPRRAWFPIRLSIARRGIKPRKIIELGLRNSRPYIAARSQDAGRNIERGLFKK